MNRRSLRYTFDATVIDKVLWPVAFKLSKRAPRAKDLLFGRFMTGMHQRVFTATRGRISGKVLGMPVVMLTTTGRKTGRSRTKLMAAPVLTDDRILLVGSYAGDDRTPAWVLNLQSNPDVTVTTGGQSRPMRARLANADEKETYWPVVVERYKGWERYQELTTREIPFVILEPAQAQSGPA